MNYDDIILECKTSCDECPDYLLCQYQTSSGAEKEAWLKKLIARDTVPVVEAPVVEETPVVEEACDKAYEHKPHQTEQAITLTSDKVLEIYLAIFGENYNGPRAQAQSHEEAPAAQEAPVAQEACDKAYEHKPHQTEQAITLTSDKVLEIYLAIFGENFNGPRAQAEACEEAPAAQEAPVVEETPVVEEVPVVEEAPIVEDPVEKAEENEDAEDKEEVVEQKPQKETFKLTPPPENEQLMLDMCAKRGRKLIYRPNEVIYSASFKVLGTDKKNDVGEKVKDIIDAEIKQGLKLGYLDKFDGLKSSEIKEEYEDDIVYEFADQEFKKTGVIYDGSKIKVYLYDWDLKACHHVGHVDMSEANELVPYLSEKDKYSFDVCGIITGGKAKRVVNEKGTLKIIKEKGDPIGLDVDIAVIPRKD